MKTFFHLPLLCLLLLTGTLALADPPGRVGRIAYTQGQVSFRSDYSGDWTAAELNWPVTSQNVLATAPGARAEIRIGSSALRLGPDSELEIVRLDDEHLHLYLLRGAASVRVKSRDQAQDFALQTPQGRVLLAEPARIRVDAERQPRTSVVSVFSGSARFESATANLSIRPGTRAEIADGDFRLSQARNNDYADDFDNWSAARDRRDDESVAARYVSPETTGYEELDRHGSWQVTESYGAVWYPSVVPLGWAPYRAGRWTWIEPWGWTWVDSAPWGYAPSHYGRWVSLEHRWCWVPGTFIARPVWAPALVGWVGGHNWQVTFSSGNAPGIGWFPLAPREMYVPSYSVSPTYVRQVNITHVTNLTTVTNINGVANLPSQINYRNRSNHDAITVLPQDRFVTGKTVVVAPLQSAPRQTQQLQVAPVSALVPAAIARADIAHRTPIANPPHAAREDFQREREAGREHEAGREREAGPVRTGANPAPAGTAAPAAVNSVRPVSVEAGGGARGLMAAPNRQPIATPAAAQPAPVFARSHAAQESLPVAAVPAPSVTSIAPHPHTTPDEARNRTREPVFVPPVRMERRAPPSAPALSAPTPHPATDPGKEQRNREAHEREHGAHQTGAKSEAHVALSHENCSGPHCGAQRQGRER